MTPNFQNALLYAHHRIRVLPCRERDCFGGVAKSPYIHGGFHNASSDEAQVQAWWNQWPDAVAGLPCRANGIIALDADRHGQIDGVESICRLFAEHLFDPYSVPCIATPRDGRHYLFRRPLIGTRVRGKLSAGIDVRDNAYVIAAGAAMVDGRSYNLLNGSIAQLLDAIRDATLPAPPTWLSSMLAAPSATSSDLSSDQTSAADAELSLARLEGLVRKMMQAHRGERNRTLHWMACRVGERAARGEIKVHVAVAVCTAVGLRAGLSRREAQATAKSGVKTGVASAHHGR